MRTVGRYLVMALALVGCIALTAPAASAVTIDETTSRALDEAFAQRAATPNLARGDLIELLSRRFLGTPYGADMLIGSATTPEELVVDTRRVDCFTYLDYVTALATAADRADFLRALTRVRYTDETVAFTHRRHFFTDWAATSPRNATDITASLTPAATTVTKTLNAKADGTAYLPGLPTTVRDITFIPSAAVDQNVLAALRNGDYVGAYTPTAGLDVTHVGIIATTPTGPVFRNASSLPTTNRVIDTPLTDYLTTVPGIVVLRPL